MITRKQYPNHHMFETEIGGRHLYRRDRQGRRAGRRRVHLPLRRHRRARDRHLRPRTPKAGIDYFPLTIEFEERMYAVGRIPGCFNRREGRPSERGILNSRLIDRPMRPLFDEELRNDVRRDLHRPVPTTTTTPSRSSPSSGRLHLPWPISDVPWNGPIGDDERRLCGRRIRHQPLLPSSAARTECFV